jgi:tetratricopeptide (TPR) repeat protein
MQEETVVLHEFLETLNEEADLATVAVTALRERPISEWSEIFAVHPEWVSFGPLNALLELAHRELDNDGRPAREIATFVLDCSARLSVEPGADFLRPLLIGTAWKELANALYELQVYDDAMTAIGRSLETFQDEPALEQDRAAALLTYAQIAHKQHNTAAALKAVDDASSTFLALRKNHHYLLALEVCGQILFDQKEYALTLDVFQTARTVAERLDDAYSVARNELNLGQTSVLLGALEDATHYLAKSLTFFEEKKLKGAVHRAVWGIARVARERGEFDAALDAFHQLYGEFLHRGRHRAAAAVLVELGDTVMELTGEPTYARATCQQLALTMGKYDAPTNVRDAVQYLQRQAADTNSLAILRAAFAHVRNFLDSLIGSPKTAFAVSL